MTRRLSFPALALALSGCAVATVDVDVYKGPLANHDDVQVEQMAVMATSAKPILLRLREVVAPEGAYDQLRGQGVDLSGYVPPRASGKSQFATENDPAAADAERVNAILYLYQDRRSDQRGARLQASPRHPDDAANRQLGPQDRQPPGFRGIRRR